MVHTTLHPSAMVLNRSCFLGSLCGITLSPPGPSYRYSKVEEDIYVREHLMKKLQLAELKVFETQFL